MTHRELPASGRGCFAAVVIAPIAAFAGLMALTSLLTAHEDQAAGPSLSLPHITRASETEQLETDETTAPPASTIAEQPLALRKPDTGKPARPTTTVTVPSTVVTSSSTRAARPETGCTGRTTPAETTTPTTTTTTPPPTTTHPTTSSSTAVTTTAPPATTTVATSTKTSTSDARVPKRVPPRQRPHA